MEDYKLFNKSSPCRTPVKKKLNLENRDKVWILTHEYWSDITISVGIYHYLDQSTHLYKTQDNTKMVTLKTLETSS